VGEERVLVEDDTAAVMEVEDQGRLGGGVSTTAGAADTRTRDGRAWGATTQDEGSFFLIKTYLYYWIRKTHKRRVQIQTRTKRIQE
jgi:hypothetical protein